MPTTDSNEELLKKLVCRTCNGEGHFEGIGCSDCYGSGWFTKPSEAMQLVKADREAAVREARIDELTKIYTAIDGETASNEYVFNLANAIEDRIESLNQPTKEGERT
ncbi:hypothetical protein [Streptomyces turgidiscabies]|uniref:hypothetical protein n=1 Tax=Streptomyces turgidiscabies TaxID=85558 RepID=UPI0038F6945D